MGHGLGVEVAARDHVAVVEDQRVVRGGVGLDHQHAGRMAEVVQAGAHDLGHAADGVRVLHAAAVGVGGVDGAAVQQLAHGGGHGDLAELAARLMDAGVKRFDRALDGLQRQAARHQAGREHALALEQAHQGQGRGYLGAVEQGQPFLGAEHEGLQAHVAHGLGAGHHLSIDLGLAFADQHAGQVRQRRQVAGGAHRALGGDHGQHVGVGQGQQRIDQLGAHARVAARQAHGLGGQHQAHHGVGQRIARAHAVRQHQVALQLCQAVMGDLGGGQLAEAGVDAIDDLVLIHDVLHMGLGGAHALVGGRRHGQAHAALLDGPQLGQADLAGLQRQRGAGTRGEAGSRDGVHGDALSVSGRVCRDGCLCLSIQYQSKRNSARAGTPPFRPQPSCDPPSVRKRLPSR